jgi:hypothetical protein
MRNSINAKSAPNLTRSIGHGTPEIDQASTGLYWTRTALADAPGGNRIRRSRGDVMNRMPIVVHELVAAAVFGWADVAVGIAFLVGVVLLGLFGDRLVGAIVTGVIELPAAAARAARLARSSAGRRRRPQARIVTGSSRSSSPS